MSATRVVLAGFYPPPFAGEPIHVGQLARMLREQGLEVVVLNLKRHAPPSPEYLTAASRLGLVRLLFTLPDRSTLLHLHTNGHSWKSWVMIVAAGVAARLRRIRAMLTIHSGLFPGYVSRFGWLRRVVAGWTLLGFDRLVGVNREIGEALEGLGMERRRVVVIPAFLGVPEPGELDPEDRAVVDGSRPLLVAVAGGEADPELGLATVIETLPDLAQRFPRVRAVFLGWQVGPRTRPLIEARGLGEYAVCLGEVPHERCLRLLRAADVVIRSTFLDGDAITVREALAFGVPVVASDTSFRPKDVVLFRKGDSRDLLTKLEQVLAAPRPRAEPEPADTAQELWRVYAEVLGRHSTAVQVTSTPSPKPRAGVTPP